MNKIILVGLLWAIASACNAQKIDPSKCAVFLVPDVKSASYSEDAELYLYSLVTEQNFNDMKRAHEGDVGVFNLLKIHGTWSDFNNTWKTISKEKNFGAKIAKARSEYEAVIPEGNRKLAEDCIRSSKNAYGLDVWVESSGPNIVVAHVMYAATPSKRGIVYPGVIQFQSLKGGAVNDLPPGQWLKATSPIPSGTDQRVFISRRPNEDVTGQVTVSGISDGFDVKAISAPHRAKKLGMRKRVCTTVVAVTKPKEKFKDFTYDLGVSLASAKPISVTWKTQTAGSARQSLFFSNGALPVEHRRADREKEPVTVTTVTGTAVVAALHPWRKGELRDLVCAEYEE